MNKKILKKSISIALLGGLFLGTTTGIYANEQNNQNDIKPYLAETIKYVYFYKPTGSASTKHEFVKYHRQTPSWSKRSSYEITKGDSVGTTFSPSKEGVAELNITRSTSVGGSIPANSSKYSRLGIYADMRSQKYKVTKQEYWSGKNRGSWYTTVKKPVATYIKVRYK